MIGRFIKEKIITGSYFCEFGEKDVLKWQFFAKLLFEAIVLATESQTKEMFVKDFIEISHFGKQEQVKLSKLTR